VSTKRFEIAVPGNDGLDLQMELARRGVHLSWNSVFDQGKRLPFRFHAGGEVFDSYTLSLGSDVESPLILDGAQVLGFDWDWPGIEEGMHPTYGEPVRAPRNFFESIKNDALEKGVLVCEGCEWRPPSRIAFRAIHAHHVVPVRALGSDVPTNIAMLCPNCHSIGDALTSCPNPPKNRSELLWYLRMTEGGGRRACEAGQVRWEWKRQCHIFLNF
jgi:hypothetical protein